MVKSASEVDGLRLRMADSRPLLVESVADSEAQSLRIDRDLRRLGESLGLRCDEVSTTIAATDLTDIDRVGPEVDRGNAVMVDLGLLPEASLKGWLADLRHLALSHRGGMIGIGGRLVLLTPRITLGDEPPAGVREPRQPVRPAGQAGAVVSEPQ